MPAFNHFDAPGLLTELSSSALEAWSNDFGSFHAEQFAFNFTRYFDPTAADVDSPTTQSIVWSASPATLLNEFNDRDRWALADSDRDRQDEYCEWRVTRDGNGKLTSVTFSTEVPDYWAHVATHDRSLLLELYHQYVDPDVKEEDLFDAEGNYLRNNQWNHATSTGIAHLRQRNNNLLAAIQLTADSTIQRVDANGNRVSDRRELVVCGGLGEPMRNSDPQIADVVNDAVFAGSTISLANPMGLYLQPLLSASFRTPDGTDAASFWTPVRGAPGHVVRARFEVPHELEYVLGDLTVDGRPLEFGTQVADKVPIRIDALVAPATTPVTTRPCGP